MKQIALDFMFACVISAGLLPWASAAQSGLPTSRLALVGNDEAVQRGREALESGDYPWYDTLRDDLVPLPRYDWPSSSYGEYGSESPYDSGFDQVPGQGSGFGRPGGSPGGQDYGSPGGSHGGSDYGSPGGENGGSDFGSPDGPEEGPGHDNPSGSNGENQGSFGADPKKESDAGSPGGSESSADHASSSSSSENAAQSPAESEDPKQNDSSESDHSASQGLGGLTIVAWILIGALLTMLLCWVIMQLFRRQESSSPASSKDKEKTDHDEAVLPVKLSVPRGDLLSRVRQCVEAEDFNQAMIYMYTYQLLQLDRAGHIRLARNKTNRQYSRELDSQARLRSIFDRSIVVFEDAFFGDRKLTKQDFAPVMSQASTFQELVEDRSA